MPEVDTDQLKQVVENMHGGTANYVQAAPVSEWFEGEHVWEGVVHVFDLVGNPQATRAYAWSHDLPDGNRRFFAVLHIPPIDSPATAVRAVIVAEHRPWE